jgi:cell division protein FtsW
MSAAAAPSPGPGWHPKTSSILLVLIGMLSIAGLVMVGSASTVVSLNLYGSPWAILIREVMWMAIGLVALVFTCRFDYRHWRRLSGPLLVVTLVLLVAVLAPGIGVHAGGSSRWIGFGQLRLQPSELLKLALVLFAADLIVRKEDRRGDHRTIVGPVLLVAALGAGLVVIQPDMGTALVLGCIAMALLFASGVPMGPVIKVLGAIGALALIVAMADPYRRARILSFLSPGAHQSGSGYQVVQSLIGLGSGHLFGLGLGDGREKWGLLPNAHTDFIFSVIGEELGLVGALGVLLLLGALAWFGLRAATRAPDRFGGLLAVGLVAWMFAETVINVGAVIGVLPVTGIPLPFISFGGSSLVITMAGAGILVNVARHEHRPAGRRPGTGTSAASAGRTADVAP